jgi:hypothetical protein
MNTIRPKNELRYVSDISNLVALIVLQIKQEFKNIELERVKTNNELIVFIMELIEAGIVQDKVISKRLIGKLDKNKLVLDIFEAMFESITEEDKRQIEDKIQFILDNKVLRRNNFFFSVLKKSGKTCTHLFCCLSQNFVSNTIQNHIPFVSTLPSSVTQLVAAKLCSEIGLSTKIIVLILLFL